MSFRRSFRRSWIAAPIALALPVSVLGGGPTDGGPERPARVGTPYRIDQRDQPAGKDSGYRSPAARPPRLQPVDQGLADRNAISTSLRLMPLDFSATPIGFKQLYRLPGDDTHFIRGEGSLYATFPYSVYQQTKKGLAPTVPPSTVFSIGMPRRWFEVQRASTGRDRIDHRVAPIVADRPLEGPPLQRDETRPPPPGIVRPLPPIVASEAYRRAFYAELLAARPQQ